MEKKREYTIPWLVEGRVPPGGLEDYYLFMLQMGVQPTACTPELFNGAHEPHPKKQPRVEKQTQLLLEDRTVKKPPKKRYPLNPDSFRAFILKSLSEGPKTRDQLWALAETVGKWVVKSLDSRLYDLRKQKAITWNRNTDIYSLRKKTESSGATAPNGNGAPKKIFRRAPHGGQTQMEIIHAELQAVYPESLKLGAVEGVLQKHRMRAKSACVALDNLIKKGLVKRVAPATYQSIQQTGAN